MDDDKWSKGLPRDVLGRILNLCSLSDGVRMGCVCKSWSLVSKWSRRRRPELPWLMMTSDPNSKYEGEEEVRSFFSLSENRIYSIKIPEMRDWICCGSFNNGGWLLIINRNLQIRLFHPWRKVQLQLPHYSTIHPVGFIRPYPPGFQYTAIRKAAMSDNAALVAIIDSQQRLAFCRTGEDKTWTRIVDFLLFFLDIIYHKGQFYAVDSNGEIGVVRFNKSSPYVETLTGPYAGVRISRSRGEPLPCDIPWLEDTRYRNYLVADSASNRLLTVKRTFYSRYDINTTPHYLSKTVGFEVYEKLLEESTEKKTVVLESIGDMAMFLGMNSSMLIMAGQFPGLEENCIYFTDDLCGPHYLNRLPNGCTDMGIFNLEDKTIRPLFLKRFHPPFSPPTWITPLL
ncbi:hypothetical protein AAC387_Pa05g3286 [Persea americana]